MRFLRTELEGVVIVEPDIYRDARGFFVETYHQEKYVEGGIPGDFVQDNHSRSVHGVLRGLHAQRTRQQGKLVHVVEGEVFDVAVDARRGSPTFGRWVSVLLTAGNLRQIFVPPGFLHGFCVVSGTAQVAYKCTGFYDPADEVGVIWNDPRIGIDWPVKEPILSAKDRAHPLLEEVADSLPA